MSSITITTVVNAPVDKVWECWNQPEHIVKWAFSSDDWEAPKAKNDLRAGGKFTTTMAAKDKTESFDFAGTYSTVEKNKLIEYNMDDGRHVRTKFTETPEGVEIVQTFDPENENSEELQKNGWKAILDNFKKHAESQVE